MNRRLGFQAGTQPLQRPKETVERRAQAAGIRLQEGHRGGENGGFSDPRPGQVREILVNKPSRVGTGRGAPPPKPEGSRASPTEIAAPGGSLAWRQSRAFARGRPPRLPPKSRPFGRGDSPMNPPGPPKVQSTTDSGSKFFSFSTCIPTDLWWPRFTPRV